MNTFIEHTRINYNLINKVGKVYRGKLIDIKNAIFDCKFRPQIFKNYLNMTEDDGVNGRKLLSALIHELIQD